MYKHLTGHQRTLYRNITGRVQFYISHADNTHTHTHIKNGGYIHF